MKSFAAGLNMSNNAAAMNTGMRTKKKPDTPMTKPATITKSTTAAVPVMTRRPTLDPCANCGAVTEKTTAPSILIPAINYRLNSTALGSYIPTGGPNSKNPNNPPPNITTAAITNTQSAHRNEAGQISCGASG